jgi:DNA gyrase/topoisomerase IV subunit B
MLTFFDFTHHPVKGLFKIIEKIFIVEAVFFNSNDYKKIASYVEDTSDLFSEESFIQMGERKQPVDNFKQAFNWMMREVKKGQHIQRYKGLGEMNPEQLFETITIKKHSFYDKYFLYAMLFFVDSQGVIFSTTEGKFHRKC